MESVGPVIIPQCLRSNPSAQQPPLPILIGEHPLLISKTIEGNAMVTNFRFCVCEQQPFINIPLMAIGELLVVEAAKRLRISCKDGSTHSCTFATAEDCQVCISLLKSVTGLPQSPEDLFAYKFYAASTYVHSLKTSLTTFEEKMVALCQPVSSDFAYSLDKEAERLGFDVRNRRIWRISQANAKFEFCPTYPKSHILPAAVDDDKLKVSLDFRALKRFPSVVWRDKRTGMVLIRSSQPLSSFLGVSYFTNHADVSLIEEIVNACNRDWLTKVPEEQTKPGNTLSEVDARNNFGQENGQRVNSYTNFVKGISAPGSLVSGSSTVNTGQGTSNGTFDSGDSYLPKKLAIVDCRSLAGVWGNSFKGGGTEDEAVYKCNIVHLDLANIHTVRDSFHKLRAMCHAYMEGMFFKSLNGCMWLTYLSALLRGANIVVELIHVMKRPVLVHCSDGWDRTSQIISLSELMLDSYYRTLEGFQVLVEREWLHFGHKFGERGGHDPSCCDTSQISPIFLQFLDCVHQLTLQYPTEFQFNESYLVKLLQHSQACLFGNFLHNCQKERENFQQKTASVWALLKPERVQFVNFVYKPSDQVLIAKSSEHNTVLWKSVYMPGLSPLPHVSNADLYQDLNSSINGEGMIASTNGMSGPKSLDDLSKVSVDSSDCSVSRVTEIAASAPGNDGPHIESSASELIYFPEDSPQIHSKVRLSGKSEESFKDPPWKINTDNSRKFEQNCSSRGSLPTSPKSISKASATNGIQEVHTLITLQNTPDGTSQTSCEQISLTRLSCKAPPDEARNINQINNDLSTDKYAVQSLLSSSPGLLCHNNFTRSRQMQTLYCDNSTVGSNPQVHSLEKKHVGNTTNCPIFRSKSLDNVASFNSFSQISISNNKSITSGYNQNQSSLSLESSDVTQDGFIRKINSANTVEGMRSLSRESSPNSVKSYSHLVFSDHTRRELYRKLGINSNHLANTCFDSTKINNVKPLERDTIGTSYVDAGIVKLLDSAEVAGIVGTRTNTIAVASHTSRNEMKRHSKPLEVGIQHDETILSLLHSDDDHPSDRAVIDQPNVRLQLVKVASGASPPDSSYSQCTCFCHWSGARHKCFASEDDIVARRLLWTAVAKSTADNSDSDSHIVQTDEPGRKKLHSAGMLSDAASDVSFETGGESETKMMMRVADCSLCDSGFSIHQREDLCWDAKMICRACCSPNQETGKFLNKPAKICLRCHSQNLQLSPGASSDGRIPTLVADG